MRALVVYESMYWNTRQVAGAVAQGARWIGAGTQADLPPCGDFRPIHALNT